MSLEQEPLKASLAAQMALRSQDDPRDQLGQVGLQS